LSLRLTISRRSGGTFATATSARGSQCAASREWRSLPPAAQTTIRPRQQVQITRTRCGIAGMIVTRGDPATAIGYLMLRLLARIAHPVASTPYGLDIVFAARRLRQLFAQMADEYIDDP
jgi:hypothetical protein